MGQRGKVKGSMDSPYELEANGSEELEQDGRNRRKGPAGVSQKKLS